MTSSQLDSDHRCGPGSNCQEGAVTKVPSEYVYQNYEEDDKPQGYDYTAGPCPEGMYCLEGLAAQQCETATFSNKSSTVCNDCPAGYSCTQDGDNIIISDCEKGMFCVEGSEPAECPAGTYNPYEQARRSSDCIDCVAGKYCPDAGQINNSSAIDCAAGYYCDGGDATQTPSTKKCVSGQYCPAGSKYGSPCPPGKKCIGNDQLFPCDRGTECTFDNDGKHRTDACPVGHYCDGGDAKFPEACDRGYFQNQPRRDSCEKCTDKVCDGVGTFTTIDSTPCVDGFYCFEDDTAIDRQDFKLCELGYQCSDNKRLECNDGTYQDSEGQAACNVCFSGYQCDQGIKVSSVTTHCEEGKYCSGRDSVNSTTDRLSIESCPKGTYLDLVGGEELADCIPCKAGFACAQKGLPVPSQSCDEGYFCSLGADRTRPSEQTSPTAIHGPCPEGTYCPEKENIAPVKCPKGTYRSRGRGTNLDDCVPCPAGYYCDEPGLSSAEDLCLEGFFCDEGQFHSFNFTCTEGHYCSTGSSPTQDDKTKGGKECPTGTFSPALYLTDESECTECPIGRACTSKGLSSADQECDSMYYCPGGSKKINDKPCESNYHCSGSNSFPEQCPVDFYSTGKRSSSCKPCEGGKLCSPEYQTNDSVSYKDCPAGYYCNYTDTQITNPIRCRLGTYNTKDARSEESDCLVCEPGNYCDGTRPWDSTNTECAEGFICEEAAFAKYPFEITTEYNTCSGLIGLDSKSAICPAGSGCPAGSKDPIEVICPIGKYTNVEMAGACLDCPPGFNCFETNITDYNAKEVDASGDEIYKYACPEGSYCVTGIPFQCDTKTYNPRKFGSSEDDCLPCPGGYLCETRGKTEVTDDDLCPAGSFCSKGSIKQDCEIGHYCPEGSVIQIKCPAGYFCNQKQISDYSGFPCPEGKYCAPGTGQELEMVDCMAGFFCTEGTPYQEPCPPGTFNSEVGSTRQENCRPCPFGKYCPGYAISDQAENLPDCPAGFYCAAGTFNPNETPCPRGYKCPKGDVDAPIPCHGFEGNADGGFYQDALGSDDCKVCPEGYFCLDKSETENGIIYPFVCPVGHFCPAGTSDYDQPERKCQPGTYGSIEGLTTIDQCTPCWGGYYCDEMGSINGKGQIDLNSDEKKCSAGFYCPDGSDSSRQEFCPVGFYCEEGSPGPRPCPRGTSPSMGTQATSPQECEPCSAGNYCQFIDEDGADFPVLEEKPCLSGYVCVRGAYSPTPAHYNEDGIERYICIDSENSCFDGANMTWPDFGWPDDEESAITGYPCQVGWKCNDQLGLQQEEKCERGTYQPRRAQQVCEPCPRGRFCGDEGLSESKPCSAGNICEEGLAYEIPCQPGYYSDVEGLWDQEQCKICPAGKKCPQKSNGDGCSNPVDCEEGFYCKEGVADPVEENAFCPKGFYCPKGTKYPEPCPPGTYGAQAGLSKLVNTRREGRAPNGCQPCRVGYFCPYWGMDSDDLAFGEPQIIDARFECSGGFLCNNDKGDNNCKVRDPAKFMCEVGRSCDSKQETPCSSGSFQSAGGQADCLTCPSGSSCFGVVADGNGLGKYEPCPVGQYCAEGEAPLDCLDGTYSDFEGAGAVDIDRNDCFECPPGFYCNEGKIKAECDAGYMCYSGSETNTPGLVGGDNGEPCPFGYYCTNGAKDISKCSIPGHFVQYPADKFPEDPPITNNKPGATDESLCSACEDGFFCPEGARTTKPCNVGGYCQEGNQIECEPGTYNDDTSGVSADDCEPCELGWYCPDPGQATYEQYPAYPGYFIDYPGASTLNDTEKVSNGTYLPVAEAVDNTVGETGLVRLCEDGYYCSDLGSASPTACDEGYFCPPADFQDVDNLFPDVDFSLGNKESLECPRGYYCPQTKEILPCDPGYYCPAGSAFQTACGEGLFCPESGVCPEWEDQDLSDSLDGLSPCRCPNGYYEITDSIRSSLKDTCAACPPGIVH